MSDEHAELPQTEEPAEQAPPPPDPWERFASAGIKPDDPDALDVYNWGRDLWNQDTRLQTVLDVINSDPGVQAEIARMYQQQPSAPQYDHQRAGLPGPDPNEVDYPMAQQQQGPPPDYVSREEMEAIILQDRLGRQIETLAARENLNEAQQNEVFQRAWGNIMSGHVTPDAFNGVAAAALNDIRGVWLPQPPAEPSLEAAQQIADARQAPGAMSVDAGNVPGGEQPPADWKEAIARAYTMADRD